MLVSVLTAALAFVSPQVHARTTPHCHAITAQNIGDPLTLSESCYEVSSYATVTAPITVQPGVTVFFDQGAALVLQSGGSLNAVGTPEKPIVFRGKEHAPGFWYGIQFSSNSPKNHLSYVTVEDGAGYGGTDDGNVVVSVNARLAIDHTTLRNSKRNGLYIDQNGVVSEFEANHFEQNETPINLKAGDLGILDATTTYSGNKNNWVLVHFGDSVVTDNAT